jgi:hypothetical protein
MSYLDSETRLWPLTIRVSSLLPLLYGTFTYLSSLLLASLVEVPP